MEQYEDNPSRGWKSCNHKLENTNMKSGNCIKCFQTVIRCSGSCRRLGLKKHMISIDSTDVVDPVMKTIRQKTKNMLNI